MKIKNKKELLYLFLIFLSALFLRLFKQPLYPSCLHRDEVQFAYNAYSILKTAKDEWGEFLPLHFKFNGEDHVPTIFYLIAGSFTIFGVNDVSVRIPAIILGSIIPIIGYLFVRELFQEKKIAYIFAAFLVINPWQIINSRASGEISIISLFFGMLGLLFIFKFINNKKYKFFILSCINLVLAYFSYIASRLDIPLILLLLIIVFYNQIPRKKIIIPILIVIIIYPFILVANHPKRFNGTSIFTKNIESINQNLNNLTPENKNIEKLKIYLKGSRDIVFEFIDNYFDYLNPLYIFKNMGGPDRTNIHNIGALYLVDLFFVIYGVYSLQNIKTKNNKSNLFILLIVLIAPIVGSLTQNYPDQPNTARTVYFYFFLSLLSSIGVFSLTQYSKKHQKNISILIFSTIFANFLYFGMQLLKSSSYLGKARSCGYEELFAYLNENQSQYNKMYIGTEYDWPYVFQLWYGKYNPKEYHQFLKEENPKIVFIHTYPKYDWSIGKYIYTHQACPLKLESESLFVGNFNHCKEKSGIRVYEYNNRLLFTGSKIPLLFSRNRDYVIFEKINDVYDSGGKFVFNLYRYNPKIDIELTEEAVSLFKLTDSNNYQEI